MKWRIAIAAICGLILTLLLQERIKVASRFVQYRLTGKKTVADRLSEYGDNATARLKPYFDRAHLSFPPKEVILLAIKDNRTLEVFARDADMEWRYIREYPILAASGTLGPKIAEGDRQVPEGLYRIESLNPDSLYHLSLRLNYPNDFDRQMAQDDGRSDLGSDIMIHGSNMSIGCLAMGDSAAEDLFVLAARSGIENVSVIISPVDFRKHSATPKLTNAPAWIDRLYEQLKTDLKPLTENQSAGGAYGSPAAGEPPAHP
ncbi:MAG: L,D-transpeptidase family protein [Lentisphaerae bacterium]|jgi:hypothetical protein|nr:L,D-transpeptidase family protein [Lentisphaerota bacterium]